MNNKEILKIKKLKEEQDKIDNELRELVNFYRYYRNSFKKEESIKAIEKIYTYIQNQINKDKEINIEIEKISKTLESKCKHKIILGLILEYKCPICKTKYKYEKNIPETTEYIINNSKENNEIDTIILNNSNEEEINKQLLNYFNELQYSEDIKIRRRTK